MKAVFAFLFLLVVSFKGFSQFETPKKTINIAPISNPKGSVSPTSSKAITYPSIFDKKDKLTSGVSLLKKKPEEEKSVFEKEKFANTAIDYTEKFNMKLKKEGETSIVDNADFFYGEFTVHTHNLYIACRDMGEIDGDNVCIWVNGERIVPLIYLQEGFQKFPIELKEGVNVIKIEALNTGMLFPNTGQFTFFDGNKKLVTNQSWMLNSGYNAVINFKWVVDGELEVIEKEVTKKQE